MHDAVRDSFPGIAIVDGFNAQEIQQDVKFVAVVRLRRCCVVFQKSIELVNDRTVNEFQNFDRVVDIDFASFQRFDQRAGMQRVVVFGELRDELLDAVVKNRPYVAECQRPGVEEFVAEDFHKFLNVFPDDVVSQTLDR